MELALLPVHCVLRPVQTMSLISWPDQNKKKKAGWRKEQSKVVRQGKEVDARWHTSDGVVLVILPRSLSFCQSGLGAKFSRMGNEFKGERDSKTSVR